MSERITGRIVSMKRESGYCFLESLDGHADRVFCHITSFVSRADWDVADVDDRVSFVRSKAPDGRLRAAKSELIGSAKPVEAEPTEAAPKGYTGRSFGKRI